MSEVRRIQSADSGSRREAARSWLTGRPANRDVLVVGQSIGAAREFLLSTTPAVSAAFGWHRTTARQLASELALWRDPRRAPIGRMAELALIVRTLHDRRDRLGRYADVADAAGFAETMQRVIRTLRASRVPADDLAEVDPPLAAILRFYEELLSAHRVRDEAGTCGSAVDELEGPAGLPHRWAGIPVLWLDAEVENEGMARLARALISQAPEACVTGPADDPIWRCIGEGPADRPETPGPESLSRLQRELFRHRPSAPRALDDSVQIVSAPGEGREATEIARSVLSRAEDGVPFEQLAVLVRSPDRYWIHLEEAFRRAGIPAWFDRGVRAPDPAGRALLALLQCRAEDYSASRFAEYLSLAQVPDGAIGAGASAAAQRDDRGQHPVREDLEGAPALPVAALEGGAPRSSHGSVESVGDPGIAQAAGQERAEVVAGSIREPRRWEAWLVEAAVVGGIDRWERRLDGLRGELRSRFEGAADEEDPAAEAIRAELASVERLQRFALPTLESMSDWGDRVRWGVWLTRLRHLALRALRRPGRIVALLDTLAPLEPVGPVPLSEVVRALRRHLQDVAVEPEGHPRGRVWVGGIDSARGRSFDTVFVPGLADHMFPQAAPPSAFLADPQRETLLGGGLLLPDTAARRVEAEQQALRLAAGAAERRIVLSYPRMDVERSRARVPSFYLLEAIRAAAGELPLLEVLQDRADRAANARIGWPAPENPDRAIDAAEYDLATLARLFHTRPPPEGAAHYLLHANPYLRRHLRARLRRWHPSWTYADGLMEPGPAGARHLSAQLPDRRSYSATALQSLAACPYQFYLRAIRRLRAREVPRAIERLDPLSRGALIHDVQFALGQDLKRAGLLPLDAARLAEARSRLETVFAATADRYHESLAPAIEQVWTDELARIREDLVRWLEDGVDRGWQPWKFEFGFGLEGRPGAEDSDPDSLPDPVEVAGGLQVRGKIDLVERRVDADGATRVQVVDHKTGTAWAAGRRRLTIGGGEILQPALYALVAEQVWPHAEVSGGELYYATRRGEYQRVSVGLGDAVRTGVAAVGDAVRRGVTDGTLPALPRSERGRSACQLCDFVPICGPNEPFRTRRKPRVDWLEAVRSIP